MDCPRCGSRIESYSLGGRSASICRSCGYVGVPVDHGSEPEDVESWDEALQRFYDVHRQVGDSTSDPDATAEGMEETADDSDPETEPAEADADESVPAEPAADESSDTASDESGA